MELDLPKTVVAFVLVIAIGTVSLLEAPMGMTTDTVLTMVMPSMVIFGLITLAIGVAYGQHRATR